MVWWRITFLPKMVAQSCSKSSFIFAFLIALKYNNNGISEGTTSVRIIIFFPPRYAGISYWTIDFKHSPPPNLNIRVPSFFLMSFCKSLSRDAKYTESQFSPHSMLEDTESQTAQFAASCPNWRISFFKLPVNKTTSSSSELSISTTFACIFELLCHEHFTLWSFTALHT